MAIWRAFLDALFIDAAAERIGIPHRGRSAVILREPSRYTV